MLLWICAFNLIVESIPVFAENTSEKNTTKNESSTDSKSTDYVIPVVSGVIAFILGTVLLISTIKFAARCQTVNMDNQKNVLKDRNQTVNNIWNQVLPFATSPSSRDNNHFEDINLEVNNASFINRTFGSLQLQDTSPNKGLHKSVKPFIQTNHDSDNGKLVNDHQKLGHPVIKVLALPERAPYTGIGQYVKIKQEAEHFDLLQGQKIGNPSSQINHYSLALPEQSANTGINQYVKIKQEVENGELSKKKMTYLSSEASHYSMALPESSAYTGIGQYLKIKQEVEHLDLLNGQELANPSSQINHYSMALPVPSDYTEINPYAESTIGIDDEHNQDVSKEHQPGGNVYDSDGYVTLETAETANKRAFKTDENSRNLECDDAKPVNDFPQKLVNNEVTDGSYEHINYKRSNVIQYDEHEIYNRSMDMYDTTDIEKHVERKVDIYDHVNIRN